MSPTGRPRGLQPGTGTLPPLTVNAGGALAQARSASKGASRAGAAGLGQYSPRGGGALAQARSASKGASRAGAAGLGQGPPISSIIAERDPGPQRGPPG